MKYVYRTSPEVCSDSIEMEISGAGEISCPQARSAFAVGRMQVSAELPGMKVSDPPGVGRFAPRRDLLLPPGKSRQKLA